MENLDLIASLQDGCDTGIDQRQQVSTPSLQSPTTRTGHRASPRTQPRANMLCDWEFRTSIQSPCGCHPVFESDIPGDILFHSPNNSPVQYDQSDGRPKVETTRHPSVSVPQTTQFSLGSPVQIRYQLKSLGPTLPVSRGKLSKRWHPFDSRAEAKGSPVVPANFSR